MPEIVTTNIHVSVDPETIREAVEAALNAHDDRADQLARKHARATDEIRTMKLQIKARSAMIESRARQQTEERIDFQRQITNLQEELRVAQGIIRKAGYGIHNFPCKLTGKDGSVYKMSKDTDGQVVFETNDSGGFTFAETGMAGGAYFAIPHTVRMALQADNHRWPWEL